MRLGKRTLKTSLLYRKRNAYRNTEREVKNTCPEATPKRNTDKPIHRPKLPDTPRNSHNTEIWIFLLTAIIPYRMERRLQSEVYNRTRGVHSPAAVSTAFLKEGGDRVVLLPESFSLPTFLFQIDVRLSWSQVVKFVSWSNDIDPIICSKALAIEIYQDESPREKA